MQSRRWHRRPPEVKITLVREVRTTTTLTIPNYDGVSFMKARVLLFVLLSCGLLLSTAVAAQHKLSAVSGLPEGLSRPIAATVHTDGHRVSAAKGTVCEVWLVKDIAVKSGFQPTLGIKYPLIPGQLVGVMRVADKSGFSDFRGQDLKGGLYTLRYGQQPEDGNHIGTSELADFLLAIPSKVDTKPEPIRDFDKLAEKSARSAGATHPAIFSLLPNEKPVKKATLTHDGNNDFWILSLPGRGRDKDQAVPVALRLVVIGRALE